MTIVERTPEDALFYADGVIFTIKELHDNNMQRYEKMRMQAALADNRYEHACVSLWMLQLSFGLARLATHAASLQMAAESEEYARKLWAKTDVN